MAGPRRKPENEEVDDAAVSDSDAEVTKSTAADDSDHGEENLETENDNDPDAEARARSKIRKSKERRRSNAYRALAKSAANLETGALPMAIGDSTACLVSAADAKRLSTFIPATPGKPSFAQEEFAARLKLYEQGISSSAVQETQIRCDQMLRWAISQALLRNIEQSPGRNVITPSVMQSVLRPFAGRTLFTSVTPPLGLIRAAQKDGILKSTQNDEEVRKEEKQAASSNKRKYEELQQSRDAKQKQRQEARSARSLERAQAAA